MINGKKLYAYNKDTGQREELQIEASSLTFDNSAVFSIFSGSTETDDGFGGGFFPKPLKTHWGSFVDSNKATQKIPFFLAADGTWRYAVTDTSMYLRKDDAETTYVKKTDKIAKAEFADVAETANKATKLAQKVNITVDLNSSLTAGSFDGSDNIIFGVVGSVPEERGGTGRTKLSDVEVGIATKARTDINGLSISDNYVRKPVITVFKIPSTGWTQDATETSEFVWYYDISIPGTTASDIPTITLERASQSVAIEAGFYGAAESLTDKVRVRCKEKPAAAIDGSCYLVNALLA